MSQYNQYPQHLFLMASNCHSNIPVILSVNDPIFLGAESSGLVWVPVNELYLRGNRLRPPGELVPRGEISEMSKHANGSCDSSSVVTPSIQEIASAYRQNPDFNSEPLFVHCEEIPEKGKNGLVVYEGRHRSAGALLAGRQLILARFIGEQHPRFKGQHSPAKPDYYGKPLFPIEKLVELHRND